MASKDKIFLDTDVALAHLGWPLRTATNVHNPNEVLFHLTAIPDPQRDRLFTKGPSDMLDQATSEIATVSKLGIEAEEELPGKVFKRPWPPAPAGLRTHRPKWQTRFCSF